MKIFKINEFDYYMADSLLEAVECAMMETGLSQEEIYDEDFACELEDSDLDYIHYHEDIENNLRTRSFREELNRREQKAQLFATSNY